MPPPISSRLDSNRRATTDRNEDLSFGQAVLRGLHDTPRWLPCRFLYDAEGSRLFEQITEQPEYYLTRAESSILERNAREIA